MCYRLHPDIIVAAEINNNIIFYGIEKPIIISIYNCLAHQSEYTRFGFDEQAFIGYEGKEWDKKDYIKYFSELTKYFEEIEPYKYKLNKDAFIGIDGKLQYSGILTQGVYTPWALRTLRIFTDEDEVQTVDSLVHGQKRIGPRIK